LRASATMVSNLSSTTFWCAINAVIIEDAILKSPAFSKWFVSNRTSLSLSSFDSDLESDFCVVSSSDSALLSIKSLSIAFWLIAGYIYIHVRISNYLSNFDQRWSVSEHLYGLLEHLSSLLEHLSGLLEHLSGL
jgi:hypothetical protein